MNGVMLLALSKCARNKTNAGRKEERRKKGKNERESLAVICVRCSRSVRHDRDPNIFPSGPTSLSQLLHNISGVECGKSHKSRFVEEQGN